MALIAKALTPEEMRQRPNTSGPSGDAVVRVVETNTVPKMKSNTVSGSEIRG